MLKVVRSLAEISPAQWDAIAGPHPLLRHAFLHTLEHTQCVGGMTGWVPEHLTWWKGDTLVAALPLYRKTHSWGEFVFDWSWARAYQAAGGAYYPKLVSALPFTPCPGARLLVGPDADRDACIRDALSYARAAGVSSLHVLFCDEREAQAWTCHGAMHRTGVQFHWTHPGVATFDEYLQTMSHDKRKRIKQERRKVREAGVTFRVLIGEEIGEQDWQHFYRCTSATFGMRGSTPYLTDAFFRQYAQKEPSAQVLVIGQRDGHPICAALNWRGGDTLYGRYWGTLQYIAHLHFETCYYQALEWALAHGIRRIEGGAQGEHKLARGFLPVETHSVHWMADPHFAQALRRYLERERLSVSHAISELEESSPFKSVP